MEYVQVLLPTIVVALIFWFVIRALFRVDRNERLAESEAERRVDGIPGTNVSKGARADGEK
ncbi:hypothetical protein [Zhihengliuella sp.]|uniref:hypothetical protein n=1 Tax=Zhihengliuella sp. TaxID=1954483 RepID=UPI002810AE3F|nr:hypothetical protein [Zhihengliuella sp.]